MGAFCVFGISRSISRARIAKNLETYEVVADVRRELTVAEWAQRRDAAAETLFAVAEKPYQISPTFDSPQRCADWMVVSPSEIRLAKIMVRGPKLDGEGEPVLRNGAQVMTWHKFTDINQFKRAGK